MIRIAIVDDQPLIRSGLRAILSAEADLEVVGEAGSGAEAERVARDRLADVVLMDVEMPVVDGIEGTRRVIAARPECRVLMLTMFDLDEYVFAALRAGAAGFLLKTTSAPELAAAIRACHSGEMLFAPAVTRRLVEAYVRQPPPPATGATPAPIQDLTAREVDVLRAMARGLSNAEIAGELHLGVSTVKTHVTRVLFKLGLRDRVQAVVLAYECGLVFPSGLNDPA